LMASIYDKALKRKDFLGIIDQEKETSEKDMDKDGESNTPKAGTDISKIVDLMAGDVNRVQMTVSTSNIIYGAPFEILLASLFLYNLLGFSGLTGFLVLLPGWLLNLYIARSSICMQKGLLAARDRRMGVLSEMIDDDDSTSELGGILTIVDVSTDIDLDYLILCVRDVRHSMSP
ncbi:hypothetical protein DXG01_003303, partial [Tephrocybe rancida]